MKKKGKKKASSKKAAPKNKAAKKKAANTYREAQKFPLVKTAKVTFYGSFFPRLIFCSYVRFDFISLSFCR